MVFQHSVCILTFILNERDSRDYRMGKRGTLEAPVLEAHVLMTWLIPVLYIFPPRLH